jgi:prepilin-type N-terminal cleavage/methylation domain-containing protein
MRPAIGHRFDRESTKDYKVKRLRRMNRERQSNKTILADSGFTLIEMMFATVIVLVGLVAVAQLVPSSLLMNSNNRNDATALVMAQRELEAMREAPLSGPPSFTDPLGVVCPIGQTCLLGDPTQPNTVVGSPVVLFQGSPVIDFSAAPVPGYNFTYTDPNDPLGALNDFRWAVITNVNIGQLVVSRRIILGVFRRGMRTPSYPVTLDVMVEK